MTVSKPLYVYYFIIFTSFLTLTSCQFASRHKEIYGDSPSQSSSKASTSKLSQLLQELESSDEEDTTSTPGESAMEPIAKPWKTEFIQWMEHNEQGMEGKNVMTWWGVSEDSFSINTLH
jgi:hypothetical protein